MAAPKIHKRVEKPKRSKKRKSRYEVSSSDSDSSVEQRKSGKGNSKEFDEAKSVKKGKKSRTSKTPPVASPESKEHVSMADQHAPESSHAEAPNTQSTSSRQDEDFTSIYLRKITSELADDLDKVREANDFTNRSLPMLIHALKQGESIFSAEEKRRAVGAANAN